MGASKIKKLFWRGEEPSPPGRPTGDAEQVLAAYEAGDPKQIAGALAARLTAIEVAVAAEHKRTAERCAARTGELEAATVKGRADLEAMKQRIGALERQLVAAASQVQQQNTDEQARAVAFEQRARADASRLIALRDFLAKSQ